jgi:sporulation-control protein spo0M
VRFFKRLDPINADISVMLDKSTFLDGEQINGKLVLDSDEAVNADEIRLEIRVVETFQAPRYQSVGGQYRQVMETQTKKLHSEDVKISGPIGISKGYKEEFPFTFSIPPMAPTMPGGTINRKVKGVLAVKGRPDKTDEIGVNISPVPFGAVVMPSAPQIPKVRCKYCNKLTPGDTKCQNCGAPL